MLKLRIPVATYRLQFNQQFCFRDAGELVSYLYWLGISDLYASPILKARKGSLHGYDVVDPSSLNPELGSEADFEALTREIKRYGMGLLLDIVPNHMAASPENPWWQDVIEKDADSPYASYFDMDWLAFNKEEVVKQTGHRRFFDIGDLVGIRVEDYSVFEAVHSLTFRLANEGKITGLRIDHIDGLYDPLEYLLRLQHCLASQADEANNSTRFYVVVEKIFSGNETLPEEWPVFGTTGYDFTNMINALFVDSKGAKSLDDIYSRFTGLEVAFGNVIYEKQKLVIEQLFAGEMLALGQYLGQLAQQDRHTVNLSPEELTRSLIEVTACLPVYRTYTRNLSVSPRDKLYLENAVDEAKQRNTKMDSEAINFLRRVLTLDFPHYLTSEQKDSWLRFVLKWQQLTGAIMAKGFEDTALYCYNRLLSLNEVGGQPDSLGLSVDEFHHCNLARLEHWPHTLNATSTHDTKRSEDVRARINALSEIPEEWERRLNQWTEWNLPKKTRVKGLDVPEPNTEIFLYQMLIGAWPLCQEEAADFKERLKGYMLKAVREAKVYTNWLSPDSDYEAAIIGFVDYILESSKQNYFLEDFLRFEKQIACYGALNSLSQVLLKITSPGVPDFYQGTELWDFSLVDPDNRRPVDFRKRVKLLDDLIQQELQGQNLLVKRILKSWQDGRVKLYVTYKALDIWRADKDVFQDGSYAPLQVEGQREEHVCAFARNKWDKWALIVVPRLLSKLVDIGTFSVGQQVWGNDILLLPEDAPQDWLNVFTGEKLKVSDRRKGLSLSEIFHIFPVSLLRNIRP
ncbi:malto-oligosyltrehalose synthase [Chloroflexota bacterium]